MSIRPTIINVGKKKMYMVSPLRCLYPENGLTVEKLKEICPNDKKSSILTIYRNIMRNVRFLQIHTFYKKTFKSLLKVKLRQDYSYRRNIILSTSLPSLTDNEIYERLINTLNFIHNATLDDPETNKTARPISMEYKILKSILQYEISKNLPNNIKNNLKSKFLTIDDFDKLRKSERAFYMNNDIASYNSIWMQGNIGLFKNEICFDYLKELQNTEFSTFVEKMVYANLHFEKVVIKMNEDALLLL